MARRESARLIYAASEQDADMLYATRFFAPDAFLFLEHRGRSAVLLSDLEIDRGRKQAQVDEVVAYREFAERLPKKMAAPVADVITAFLRSRRVRSAVAPATFPLRLAEELVARGVRVRSARGVFWPERETKSEEELRCLSRALRMTEAGMERAFEVLRQSKPGTNRRLTWGGRTLTSEILRTEIDVAVHRAGGQPGQTIVAGGNGACDPHERGSGPLRANELIIVDIFPRDPRTGYYGDLTRTVVRGRASDDQRRLWETVRAGQQLALRSMKPGVAGAKLHKEVKAFFAKAGYPTEKRDGRWAGFFHGTGHALGLDLHEEPRFARTRFREGQVFTVEPGLYYHGLGGVRIEDVVAISRTGVRKLSKLPLFLEL